MESWYMLLIQSFWRTLNGKYGKIQDLYLHYRLVVHRKGTACLKLEPTDPRTDNLFTYFPPPPELLPSPQTPFASPALNAMKSALVFIDTQTLLTA